MTAKNPVTRTQYKSHTTLDMDPMGSQDVIALVGTHAGPQQRITAGPSNPTGFLEVPHDRAKTTSALEESVEASHTLGRNADDSIKVDEYL